MLVKLFTRKTCSKCPPAKQVCQSLKERGLEVMFLDVDSPNGREEAVRHHVKALPATILIDERGNELLSWRGEVPDKTVLEALVGGR